MVRYEEKVFYSPMNRAQSYSELMPVTVIVTSAAQVTTPTCYVEQMARGICLLTCGRLEGTGVGYFLSSRSVKL